MYDDFYNDIKIEVKDVITESDFVLFMKQLVKTKIDDYPGTLEIYLRALWSLVLENKDQKPSWSLLAEMLEAALTHPSPDFDPDWLNYRDPPMIGRKGESELEAFETLRKLLLYQIADLRRMKDDGTLDKPGAILFMGVQSPANKHYWYNFHPSSFLSRAVAAMNEFSDHKECSWISLAILLWLGQIYE